jgi:hypothetical protein
MGWTKHFVSCDGSLQGVVKGAMYPRNNRSFSNSYTKTKNCILLQKCHNPSFGLVTKAKACKDAGQKWSPGVTFHVFGNVGECQGMNPTLPSEPPLWELESWWTSKFSKGNFRGQNLLDWKLPYIIEKLSQHRCLT